MTLTSRNNSLCVRVCVCIVCVYKWCEAHWRRKMRANEFIKKSEKGKNTRQCRKPPYRYSCVNERIHKFRNWFDVQTHTTTTTTNQPLFLCIVVFAHFGHPINLINKSNFIPSSGLSGENVDSIPSDARHWDSKTKRINERIFAIADRYIQSKK